MRDMREPGTPVMGERGCTPTPGGPTPVRVMSDSDSSAAWTTPPEPGTSEESKPHLPEDGKGVR